jgi:hypothetical protein
MQTAEVVMIEVPGGHAMIEVISGESRWERNAIEGTLPGAIPFFDDTPPNHKMEGL